MNTASPSTAAHFALREMVNTHSGLCSLNVAIPPPCPFWHGATRNSPKSEQRFCLAELPPMFYRGKSKTLKSVGSFFG